jgi:hypothetical protein
MKDIADPHSSNRTGCPARRPWDLVTVYVHVRRFGFPEEDHRAFAADYGRDLTAEPEFAVLRAVRELRMIATNARKSAPGSPQAREVRRRVEGLRAGDTERPWQIL